MVTSQTRMLLAGAAALKLASTGGALAQQSAEPQAGGIETVVVTATRRAENIQNVAGTVTALSGAELDAIHATNFADFANFVPGLSYESGGPTNDVIAIRGVTTGATQLGSAIGLYMDDVPIGASTQFGLGFQSMNINLFDMNRVEVLNGPQGTLYGADALGGAVRYITEAPDLNKYDALAEAEGSDTEHGSFNDGLRLMANMPLLDGRAAIRIDGFQEFDSGYTQDPSHDRKDIGNARTLGGRVSFLAQLTPDLDVKLSAFTENNYATGADVVLKNFVTHQPVQGPYDQYFTLNQPFDNSLTLYSAVVNWNLDWAKLTSITGYQRVHGSYESDLTPLYDLLLAPFGAGATPFGLPVSTDTKKFSQEVRLTSPDNRRFEWVLGGYFTREITDEAVDLIDGATPNGEFSPYGYFPPALPFYGYLPSTYRELAVYGDATYYFTNRFDVTLGFRYSNQHQYYQSFISTLLLFPNYATIYHYQNESTQGVATYLVNPEFHITPDTMVYARVASGYRPGGPNFVLPATFGSTAPATFHSDELWNYELGEKSTLLGDKATFDFDVYDIEWDSIQTTANFGGINQLVNAGNARIEGAETSFSYHILPELMLNGTAAYTDAFLTTASPILGVSEKGARLPLSPRYNFALSGTYTFAFGDYNGALNIDDVYVGDRYAGYDTNPLYLAVGRGTPAYRLGAYNTVNLNLALFLPRNVELDAYLKNMFDTRGEVSTVTTEDEYLNPYFAGMGLPYAPVPVVLSQPRTVGLVLKVGLDE